MVLTGAGNRAFSAGAGESTRGGVTQALREVVARGQQLTPHIETFAEPVIAAVNGLAYGGGCEVADAAPLALSSERAHLSQAPRSRSGAPLPSAVAAESVVACLAAVAP